VEFLLSKSETRVAKPACQRLALAGRRKPIGAQKAHGFPRWLEIQRRLVKALVRAHGNKY